MSGINFLLDTNFVIGLLKGNETVREVFQRHSIVLNQCAFSFVSRIELLGFSGIKLSEESAIKALLNGMQYEGMTSEIEEATIAIRRQYKLKTPDAIIAATVKVRNFDLLTLDQQLNNRMLEILNSNN